MSNVTSRVRQIVIVNALPSGSRAVARELGAKLSEHETGTQYYTGALDQRAYGRGCRVSDKGHTAGLQPTETHMVNAPAGALEVCVRTAKLIGRCAAASECVSTHRSVALLYPDPAVTEPALAVSIVGRLQDRPYYPDMLVSHDLAEIRSEAEPASGFAAAVSRLCGPHEVVVLAIPQQHTALPESARRLREICLAILDLRPPEVLLSEEEYDAVSELARLTGASRAQRDRIIKAAHAARIRGCSVTDAVRTVPPDTSCAAAVRHIEEFST